VWEEYIFFSKHRHIGDFRLDEAKTYEQMIPVTTWWMIT